MAVGNVYLGEKDEAEEEEANGMVWMLVYLTLCSVLLLFIAVVLLKLVIWCRHRYMLRKWEMVGLSIRPVVVGFFHPYCNAGGGGERVLWQSISALQKRYSFIKCVIYTGFDSKTNSVQILKKVQDQLGITLCDKVEFIDLYRRRWVEPKCWPRLTILGQTFGSVVLGFEALLKFAPHVFVDTTGYAFVIPLFSWFGGCKTISYVHYPTVSRDMLEKVRQSESSYNNSNSISRSKVLTNLKLVYYRLYAKLYGFVGRRNDVVMVNSTWTHGHISKIWGPKRLYIVYPPCDTSAFQQLPLHRNLDEFRIVSVGQFRPEKDHELQLHILKEFLEHVDEKDRKAVTLVMIGSCRNKEDTDRVIKLRKLAKTLGVTRHVKFELNISFSRLKEELGRASAALHTMWNEHFGIGVVECMAAGSVIVAHNSGGPQMDIVVDWKSQRTGLLAVTPEHFASCLLEVLHLSGVERQVLVSSAREAMKAKFSVEVFETSFLRATEQLFT